MLQHGMLIDSKNGTVVKAQSCDGCKRQFTPPLNRDQGDVLFRLMSALCEADGVEMRLLMKCSRCKRAQYCSKDCQRQHWKQGHKSECQPINQVSEESGVTLRQLIRQELDGLVDERSEVYKDVARREVQLFQAKYGTSYEVNSGYFQRFPEGKGYFDDSSSTQAQGTRFRDYRRLRINQGCGDKLWLTWSKECEKELRSQLVNEMASERLGQGAPTH